jgi:hypothetical protein
MSPEEWWTLAILLAIGIAAMGLYVYVVWGFDYGH